MNTSHADGKLATSDIRKLSSSYQRGLMVGNIFLRHDTAIPVQSADSSHLTKALNANLGQVFDFPHYLQPDNWCAFF